MKIVHLLSLAGFGDTLSHITRIPALRKKYPRDEYDIKFWLGGYGKAPQFSKDQLELEGLEATIVKNLNFHNQLPAIRELFKEQVVQENDVFEDWSFCEEIFQNQEPPFLEYDMEFPFVYATSNNHDVIDGVDEEFKFIADRINNFTRSGRHNLIAIHPLTKSGNAEGFEHDLQQGRFWDKENWLDLCKLLIDEGNILLFVGYGDEDWGLYEELNSEYDFKVIDGRASVENTIDIIRYFVDGFVGCNSWDWEIAARSEIPTICFYTKNHFFIKVHTPQGPSPFWDNCYIETNNKAEVPDIFAKFVYMMENQERPIEKYSVCMITLDDEEVIEKTLDNIAKYEPSEFVVVDGGSKDNTKPMTAYLSDFYNLKLFNRKWDDDFSAQKNFALDQAEYDWRVWIDADETYEHIFWNQLPWYIWQAERDGTDCIYVPRINTIEGLSDEELQAYIEKQGWQMSGFRWINYPDIQQRVFKSNCKFVGRSHERIVGATRESILVGQHILHPKTKDRQQRGLDREKHLYKEEADKVFDRIMEGEE